MKGTRRTYSRLRLKSVEPIPIRSPIAKFFNAPPSQVNPEGGPAERMLDLEIENTPGPSNNISPVPVEEKNVDNDDKDFEIPAKVFKLPLPRPLPPTKPKAKPRPRTKKAPQDIRKVLGINPELDYNEEEKLQRMILQKSREANFIPDDIQMALALSNSLREHSGSGGGPSRSKINKQAVEFFEMLGMNQKKRKRTKAPKITLLTRRIAETEEEKIQSRIEEITSRAYAADAASSPPTTPPAFPICSCILFDMRVHEQRIFPMNAEGDGVNCTQMLHEYYIGSNIFPTTKVPAGHLLRDWSKIPGRSPSPEIKKRSTVNVDRGFALELEIEQELEVINKQSEAFLQNYDWGERTASPDLFADLSTSGTSIPVDADQSNVTAEKEMTGDEVGVIEIVEQDHPVTDISPKNSIEVITANECFEQLTEENDTQSPEMAAPIDLTQDSVSDNEEELVDVTYEVEMLQCSPVVASQEPQNLDPTSIDAILARARSLIDDLNGQSQGGPVAHVSPEATEQRISEPSICIIDSDEEQPCPAGDSPHLTKEKNELGSLLNGLSELEWSKDQFSMEMRSNQVQEEEAPFQLIEVNDQDMETEVVFPYPPSPMYEMFHSQPPWTDDGDSQGETRAKKSAHIIDLCDEEEDEEKDDIQVAMELEQIHYSQIIRPANIPYSPKATASSSSRTATPNQARPSTPTEVPPHQLIIRTDSVTPPPDYKSMDAGGIKRELQKYGIKPQLPPSKAILLLEHIYKQLHPLIAEDIPLADLQSNPLNETVKNLEQQLGVEPVPRYIASQIEADKQEKEKPPPKSRSKVKATCDLPLELAFNNRLRFDPDYHTKILHYNPIELKELMSYFKSIGCKYDCNAVIALLDRHCVTYRTVEALKKDTIAVSNGQMK